MLQPKVLQIGKHFHPDVGGIETVTRNISEALAEHSLTADVLCMALNSNGDREEAGYRVIRAPTNAVLFGNKTFSWSYAQKVARLSADYDVGILHMPNPLGAAAALRGWRKPLILLWHADFDHPLLSKLTQQLDVAIARKASAVVVPTKVHLERSNRARHLLPKGAIIPFPFAPRPVERCHLPTTLTEKVCAAANGRRIVLAAGRLVPYKGFDVLIRAMSSAGQSLYCVIAGGGPLKDDLEQRIAMEGVTDKVFVTGQITDQEMAGLVGIADFGCLPSISSQEMYGLTQVEMMAAGKPVVATRIKGSGVPLVNRHDETGLLAEPGDAEGLATLLRKLATEQALYDRLADGAASAFRREYSLGAVGAQYADLVRRLASER